MKKVFNKNSVIRTATKRTETSQWPLMQSTYIPNPLCAVTRQSELGMYSALRWRSLTCFCPFCGSPNDPVFCLRLFHYLYALHIASVWGNIHVHVLALVLIVMEESGYQLDPPASQIDNICWPVSPAHRYPQSTWTCPCIYLASGLLTPRGCKVYVEGASVGHKGLAGLRMQCLLSLCFLPVQVFWLAEPLHQWTRACRVEAHEHTHTQTSQKRKYMHTLNTWQTARACVM